MVCLQSPRRTTIRRSILSTDVNLYPVTQIDGELNGLQIQIKQYITTYSRPINWIQRPDREYKGK